MSIQDITNIIVAFATAFAALFAFLGIKTWRKQFLGEAKSKVAKEIMHKIYNIYDKFNEVRNPFMGGNEFPDGYYRDAMRDNNEEHADALAYAYQNRLNTLVDELKELEKINNLAVVEFGTDYKYLIKPLRCVIYQLINSIRNKIDITRKQTTCDKLGITQQELSDDLYYHPSSNKPNRLNTEILKAVSFYEKLIRPYCNMKKPSRFTRYKTFKEIKDNF